MSKLEQFPHVVSHIVAHWGTQAGIDYIRSLEVVERARVNRDGFPDEAFIEVVLLHRIHDQVFPHLVSHGRVEDIWSNPLPTDHIQETFLFNQIDLSNNPHKG
jgi:hypothetical protein